MIPSLHTGIDLVSINRLRSSLARFGDRFLQRIYTTAELEDCQGRLDSLAVRFAAKEAAAKALGCGIGSISWRDVEVRLTSQGQPMLALHGEALRLAKKLRLTVWSVSLSHEQDTAIALVVALGTQDSFSSNPIHK